MRRKKLTLILIIFGSLFLSLIVPKSASQQQTLYSEDFAGPISGWTFYPGTNSWVPGLLPFPDHSGEGFGLGTGVVGDYTDNVNETCEAHMPVVSLAGYFNVKMSFYHWYNFSDSLNDGGGIYLWNGESYINPLNDYPSAVSGDLNISVINGLAYLGHPNEKGWVGNSSGAWLYVEIDLSQIGLSNSDFHAVFVFGENGTDGVHGQGWFIDDILFSGEPIEYWIWIFLAFGFVGIIIILYMISKRKQKSQRDETQEGAEEETPTLQPDSTTPSTTTPSESPPAATPTPTPAPVATTSPRVTFHRPWSYEENPLYDNGYSYEIVFTVPCTITPEENQVIVAHVVITVTVVCRNGTYTITRDYWEAFTLHNRTDDKTTTGDKHYIDNDDLEKGIMAETGCDQILSYTVVREHTVNIGTVQGAQWYGQIDGGSFAYLATGPPPQNQQSNPAVRGDATVTGSVTSFPTAGATTFTGTYTHNAQTGASTYTSSANPGTTYTSPP